MFTEISIPLHRDTWLAIVSVIEEMGFHRRLKKQVAMWLIICLDDLMKSSRHFYSFYAVIEKVDLM